MHQLTENSSDIFLKTKPKQNKKKKEYFKTSLSYFIFFKELCIYYLNGILIIYKMTFFM